MKPVPKEFERVSWEDFVPGVISDIKYDKEHEFSFQGKVTGVHVGVKLMFTLAGYTEPKSSGWLKLMYAEKGNLYKKYVSSLVEGAKPNMDFDVDQLKGMKVKILFTEPNEKGYQYVDKIRPLDAKVVPDPTFESDTVPF